MAFCLIKVVLILAVLSIFEVNAANETLLQSSTTSAPPTTPPVCGVRYGVSAHPTLCNSYLLCSDYKVMSQVTCPPGTLFNVTTSRCVKADLVNCGKASIPETTVGLSSSTAPSSSKTSTASTAGLATGTTVSASKTPATSPQTTVASTASSQSASTKFSSTVLPQTPSSASSTSGPTSLPSTKSAVQPRCDIKDGLTQNPLKCNSFIICSNFAVISDVRCPLGTLFDVKTKMCQRSELVVCGTRV